MIYTDVLVVYLCSLILVELQYNLACKSCDMAPQFAGMLGERLLCACAFDDLMGNFLPKNKWSLFWCYVQQENKS